MKPVTTNIQANPSQESIVLLYRKISIVTSDLQKQLSPVLANTQGVSLYPLIDMFELRWKDRCGTNFPAAIFLMLGNGGFYSQSVYLLSLNYLLILRWSGKGERVL